MGVFANQPLLAKAAGMRDAPITYNEALKLIAGAPDEPLKEIKVDAYSKRNEARKTYIQKNAIPEVVAALESGKLSIATAEQLAHVSKELQLGELQKALGKKRASGGGRKAGSAAATPAQSAPAKTSTPANAPQAAKPADKPEEEKPTVDPKTAAKAITQKLTSDFKGLGKKLDDYKGALPKELIEQGFNVYRKHKGDKAVFVLGPDVSELENRDRGKVFGGSESQKDRTLDADWENYRKGKVREKTLTALFEALSEYEVPKREKSPSFTVKRYPTENADHFERMVTMLCADLQRLVHARRQIATGKQIRLISVIVDGMIKFTEDATKELQAGGT